MQPRNFILYTCSICKFLKITQRTFTTLRFKIKNINLHLLTLKARWLEANQLAIKELSLLIRVCMSVLHKHGIKLVVSSANNMKRESCEIKGRSLIYNKNITGPKMDPRGTLYIICFKVDLYLPI